jgi:hypothetical protein
MGLNNHKPMGTWEAFRWAAGTILMIIAIVLLVTGPWQMPNPVTGILLWCASVMIPVVIAIAAVWTLLRPS